MEERQKRLGQINQEIEGTTKQLEGCLQQHAEIRSRLGLIEQLQAEHEGYGAGALAVLKQAADVMGTLADRIWVPDEHVVAIETALGHHLELVLAREPETAERILRDLHEKKAGRASIAPLAFHSGGGAKPTASPPGQGVLASTIVVPDPSVAVLIESLLGRTIIVPDIATATQSWRESGGQFDFVTATGDLLDRRGVYTGGYRTGGGSAANAASILGRKNQITELSVQAAQLQERVAEASRKKGTLLSEQASLQAGLQQAQTELREQEVAVATREGELNALQNSLRVLHQKIDTVMYEIGSLAAQEQEGSQKREGLAAELRQLADQDTNLQNQLAEANARLESWRQQRDSSTAALTEIRVLFATEQQIGDSFRKQQPPLEQRIVELAHLLEQRREEIAACLTRRTQAEAEIIESRGEMGALHHEREQVSNRTAEFVSQRESQAGEIAGREDELREHRRRLSHSQEQRGSIEVELAQKEMSLQNLRERIHQKYQVNLDDVRSECITITFAAEGVARIQTLTPEEMARGGVSTDWEAVAQQTSALQQKLDEMGPVNLVAIEEYEETEQRFQFLSKQNDDLVKAKQQLNDVINRINTQTREMFLETFTRIRDNFRSMFTEVFGGGKADLILVDEGNALECGIDIVARPPGKQLQTISLLSGGEQTMTAVALLFAIYQVKPSPFCVLDELDAPLDESNINRFIRILQRFLAHSQFVIITHNKRTIGMANVLYGVTMEEQGISKIVSVKFHKTAEGVTDHRPMPLVPPPQVPPVDAEEEEPHRREETLEIVMAK
jgi:chromosome segregation protein